MLHDLQGLGSLTTIMGHLSEAWDNRFSLIFLELSSSLPSIRLGGPLGLNMLKISA